QKHFLAYRQLSRGGGLSQRCPHGLQGGRHLGSSVDRRHPVPPSHRGVVGSLVLQLAYQRPGVVEVQPHSLAADDGTDTGNVVFVLRQGCRDARFFARVKQVRQQPSDEHPVRSRIREVCRGIQREL